jgi:formamidopyrimidine-DNA glycosylase
MPELPEVETTLKGIEPFIKHQKIRSVTVRHPTLRWPIPTNLEQSIKNQTVSHLSRRGKYLLLHMAKGTLILHLGMSGSLRILAEAQPPKKHDHIDIKFSNGHILRLTDPRRFGAVLWTEDPLDEHVLLKNLGPEPLTSNFTGKYLKKLAEGRKIAVKSFIMDNKIVVGVGNIYATEALFAAKIHPETPAKIISEQAYGILVREIKKVLKAAIKQGGTTLKDFSDSQGKPGYFYLQLKAYGRAKQPCFICKSPLNEIRLGQRSSVYCSKCQPLK